MIRACLSSFILRARNLPWLSPPPRRSSFRLRLARFPRRRVPAFHFFAEKGHSVPCFYSRQHRVPGYVHLNMKAWSFCLWARISRKFTSKPEQLELDLWTRRSTR